MSTLKADTIQSTGGGAATLTKQEAAKAYAVTGHSSSTPLTTKLFNISSIGDTASGVMTFNFTSSFDSANYTRIGTAGLNESSNRFCMVHENNATQSASAAVMKYINHDNSVDDTTVAHLVFHGDLA